MAVKPTHIVDASALIAYFKSEEGHEKFADLLRDERNVLAMHTVNLCESITTTCARMDWKKPKAPGPMPMRFSESWRLLICSS